MLKFAPLGGRPVEHLLVAARVEQVEFKRCLLRPRVLAHGRTVGPVRIVVRQARILIHQVCPLGAPGSPEVLHLDASTGTCARNGSPLQALK